MTPGFGIGMFFLGIGCIIIGAIMAFFIIRQVMREREEPTRFDDLK